MYNIIFGRDFCKPVLDDENRRYLEQIMDIAYEVFRDNEKGEECLYSGNLDGLLNKLGYVKNNDKMILDKNSGCSDNIIAITKDGIIIGYFYYLTMNDKLLNYIAYPDIDDYIKHPENRDDGITGKQLKQWSKEEPNNLFIIAVAIKKEYQNTDAIKILNNAVLNELRQKEKDGYKISSIYGDTISDQGERFSVLYRMKAVSILPAPGWDKSGHNVTVRVCKEEDLDKLLSEGFCFKK